jgi:hypothetical protein
MESFMLMCVKDALSECETQVRRDSERIYHTTWEYEMQGKKQEQEIVQQAPKRRERRETSTPLYTKHYLSCQDERAHPPAGYIQEPQPSGARTSAHNGVIPIWTHEVQHELRCELDSLGVA